VSAKRTQRAAFTDLVERAVIEVYGGAWTTHEHRQRVAAAALIVQDSWDAGLQRDSAKAVGGDCVFCDAEIPIEFASASPPAQEPTP